MGTEIAQLHFSVLHPLLSQLSWTPSEVTEEERVPLLYPELTVGEHELIEKAFVACVNNLSVGP